MVRKPEVSSVYATQSALSGLSERQNPEMFAHQKLIRMYHKIMIKQY